MRLPRFIVAKSSETAIVLRDLGPWDVYPTISNAAEAVVDQLWSKLHIADMRLFYFDSEGDLGELLHDGARFTDFGYATTADLEAEGISL